MGGVGEVLDGGGEVGGCELVVLKLVVYTYYTRVIWLVVWWELGPCRLVYMVY